MIFKSDHIIWHCCQSLNFQARHGERLLWRCAEKVMLIFCCISDGMEFDSAHFFLHVCEKSQLNWNVWNIHTKSPQMFLTAKLIS